MDGLELLGVDTFGVRGENFDNTHTYRPGDIVARYGAYYQATRDITPPWFPSISAGDEPGASDAWRPVSGAQAMQNVALGLGVETIPTVGADYTDAKTVTAVQAALVKRKVYDLGDSGPNHDGVDGLLGSKTKTAIKKLQNNAGLDQTGKIDENVIKILGVTPGVLPPGVTAQSNSALWAQVALDTATLAEHADTPADVQAVAQQAVDIAPAAPPELKQAAQRALVKAKAATTPAQVKDAAADVKSAVEDVHAAVKPSWWVLPTWSGGPPRWQIAALGGGALTLGGLILFGLYGGDQVERMYERSTRGVDRSHARFMKGKISQADFDKVYRASQAKRDIWRAHREQRRLAGHAVERRASSQ